MNRKSDPAIDFLACQTLRKQLDRLAGHLDGACSGEDVEPVHKVRTTLRRLRAALRLFADCFDPKQVKKWRKEFKRVLKKLGDARDRDVQIDFLKGILQTPGASDRKIRPGIRRMELRWRQQRDRLQPRVIKAVHHLRDSGILLEVHLETERILFALKDQKSVLQSPAMFTLTTEQIGRYQEDLLARQDCLDKPEDKEGHHGMRIAAKRLRYTLEICSPAYGDRLKACMKTLKQLQTMLGDLHDCDVWAEQIGLFMEEERQRTIDYTGTARTVGRLTPGLQYLKDERQKHRDEIFPKIRAFWRHLEQEDFWESLRSIIEVKPEDSDHGGKAPDNQRTA